MNVVNEILENNIEGSFVHNGKVVKITISDTKVKDDIDYTMVDNYLLNIFPIEVTDLEVLKMKVRALMNIPIIGFIGRMESDSMNKLKETDSGTNGKIIEYLLINQEQNNNSGSDHFLGEFKTKPTVNHYPINKTELCSFSGFESWENSHPNKKLKNGIMIPGIEKVENGYSCLTSLHFLDTTKGSKLWKKMWSDYDNYLGEDNHYLKIGSKNSGKKETIIIPNWVHHNPEFITRII